ncbi:HvfC family RiPP maturation protein [[Pseudomonas] boreopolis]|uniref:HvfC family RiPP maturation protein n=1 Tax=Xanthomonas boreopolis TaxID=86183 RepID=UPI003D50DFB2
MSRIQAPAALRDHQLRMGRCLRDPEAAAMAGVPPRRLAVYRELLFNNMAELLQANFPVIRQIMAGRWEALVRDFFRDHRCTTPLFTEIGQEFHRYLCRRAERATQDPLPAFLPELAHYEWVELALSISEDAYPGATARPTGGIDDRPLVPNPLAWALAYRWPVHRIGGGELPGAPPAEPTLLLARRTRDHQVRFTELGIVAFELLRSVSQARQRTARQHLARVARRLGVAGPALATFMAQGRSTLERMLEQDIVFAAA